MSGDKVLVNYDICLTDLGKAIDYLKRFSCPDDGETNYHLMKARVALKILREFEEKGIREKEVYRVYLA